MSRQFLPANKNAPKAVHPAVRSLDDPAARPEARSPLDDLGFFPMRTNVRCEAKLLDSVRGSFVSAPSIASQDQAMPLGSSRQRSPSRQKLSTLMYRSTPETAGRLNCWSKCPWRSVHSTGTRAQHEQNRIDRRLVGSARIVACEMPMTRVSRVPVLDLVLRIKNPMHIGNVHLPVGRRTGRSNHQPVSLTTR
jgi:hypothetical protein